ncbi:restriction endonuclease subunit S [Glaesserella parasuis]|nr:restriction endonuclease subunit S [Glaesserella parasuis]
MSSWKEYNLIDLVSFSQGIQVPVEEQYKEKSDNMERFIRIVDYTNPNEEPRYIIKKPNKYWVNENDVVMIRYGWAGKVVNGIKGYIANNMFRIIADKSDVLDKEYLYYFLLQRKIYEYLVSCNSSTTMPSIKFSDFNKINIKLPTLEEQRYIVAFLKNFDKKIQLNTQINQTLEQIAQTIFKSWFIDFDPVHAKANALASGQTAEQATQAAMAVISGKNTQELHRLQTANPEQYQQLWEIAEAFPGGFDEEGVPWGWAVKRIEDVIRKIPTGKKYSQKTAFEVGNIPILDQGKSGVIGYHNDEAGVKASIENPVIVFANHTCYMRLISYDFSAIQNVFAFVGKESNVLWTYLATLGKQEFTEYKGHFPDFLIKEIIVPNNELTELFGVVVKEHFQQIACNDKQNKTLANVRDLLLPKLLSGEV